jgi:hypothetical protein
MLMLVPVMEQLQTLVKKLDCGARRRKLTESAVAGEKHSGSLAVSKNQDDECDNASESTDSGDLSNNDLSDASDAWDLPTRETSRISGNNTDTSDADTPLAGRELTGHSFRPPPGLEHCSPALAELQPTELGAPPGLSQAFSQPITSS